MERRMALGTTAVGSTSEKKEVDEEVRHSLPLDRTFGRNIYEYRVLVVRSNADEMTCSSATAVKRT